MYPEIGSYDAKTKLPELLREVQAGRRYTITLRGKPVADLVPVSRAGEGEIREAVAAMRAMPRIKGVAAADLEHWIAEGRR
jgi:prevent-host-death family protein